MTPIYLEDAVCFKHHPPYNFRRLATDLGLICWMCTTFYDTQFWINYWSCNNMRLHSSKNPWSHFNRNLGRSIRLTECLISTKDNHVVTIHCVRYMGVTHFVFHVLQLLPSRFTQRNLCCISKFAMKHQQKSDLPWFSYGYRKCMSVDSLLEYKFSPNCVHYWVWSS